MYCLHNLGQFNINTLFLYSVFKPALCVSAIYAAAMGYTRLAAGAHYLTDVAAAAITGYTAFVTVRFIYIKVSAKINNTVRISVPCYLYNSYLSIGEITGFPSLSSRGVMPPA